MTIDELETVAAKGWRAPEEAPLGGWLLRAAEGFTGRASSALAAKDPGIPLAEAAARVRRWYAARDLPAMVAVPYPLGCPGDSPTDRFLSQHGLEHPARTGRGDDGARGQGGADRAGRAG